MGWGGGVAYAAGPPQRWPVPTNLFAPTSPQDDWTPLHEATCGNQLLAVELLLTRGAVINRAAGLGWTPLHIAAREGFYDIAVFLLDSGADINAVGSKVWTRHCATG